MLRWLSPRTSSGSLAAERSYASVHYRATLDDGTLLTSSRDNGDGPLEVRVGVQPSEAVPGWDLALPLMRPGDKVLLECAPQYGFGEAGAPPLIPPAATVCFELELVAVRDITSSNNTEEVEFLKKYSHIITDRTERLEADDGVEQVSGSTIMYDPEGVEASLGMKPSYIDVGTGAVDGTGITTDTTAANDDYSSSPPDDAPPSRASGGRGWFPSATRVEVEHASGYALRETDEEVEVRIPLPPTVTSAAVVDVVFSAEAIHVAVAGDVILSGATTARLRKEDCAWTFMPADDHQDAGSGAQPVLQLDLMKRIPSSDDEPLWGYVLKEEKAGNSGGSRSTGRRGDVKMLVNPSDKKQDTSTPSNRAVGVVVGTLFFSQFWVIVVGVLGRLGVIDPPPINTLTDIANAAMDAEIAAGRLEPLLATGWAQLFWVDLLQQYYQYENRSGFIAAYCSNPDHAAWCSGIAY